MSRTTRPHSAHAVLAVLALLALAISACSAASIASPSPSPSPPASDRSPTPPGSADPGPTSPAPDDPGTSPPAAGDPDALTGPGWVLVRIEGVDLPPDASITAAFAPDGSFGGSGGCNQYGGRYAIDGDAITLSDVISTLIGCDGAVGQREGAFFAALELVETWSISEGRLILAGPEGTEPLVFEATAGEDALHGPVWLLVEMAGQEIPAEPAITAHFGRGGDLNGSGGCNTYFGPYLVDGESMGIDDAASTKIGCQGAVGEREGAFFDALAAIERWTIADGRLILDGPEGTDPLVFQPFSA